MYRLLKNKFLQLRYQQISPKRLLLLLIIVSLLVFNRFDSIMWTKWTKLSISNHQNFYLSNDTEVQVTTAVLNYHPYPNGKFSTITNASFSYRMINSTCPHVLNVKELLYSNILWQELIRANGKSVYLFSSYYDNRTIINNNPVIRIITMFEKASTPDNFYCYLWFANNIYATISKAYPISELISSQSKSYEMPYLITCPVPQEIRHKIPIFVSLSIDKCSYISNLLPVINNQPKTSMKKDFAVCLKALDFMHVDKSIYMIEWLELLFLMGVDKVFTYEYAVNSSISKSKYGDMYHTVHPNVNKVLKHYVDIDRLSVMPYKFPRDDPIDSSFRHQFLIENMDARLKLDKIPFNDCFYMNMNRYKYIAVMDLDEIFIARNVKTWGELMKNLTVDGLVSHASYNFRRIYVLDSMRKPHGWSEKVPKYMYMLQNIYRSSNYEGLPKAIHNTEYPIIVGNHHAAACLNPQSNITTCKLQSVNSNVAHVFHYRNSCKKGTEKFCILNNTIRDETIWRYQDLLIERVSHTMKKLGFL